MRARVLAPLLRGWSAQAETDARDPSHSKSTSCKTDSELSQFREVLEGTAGTTGPGYNQSLITGNHGLTAWARAWGEGATMAQLWA